MLVKSLHSLPFSEQRIDELESEMASLRFATRHELFFLLTTAAAIILCLVNKEEAQTGYVTLTYTVIH